MATVNDEESAGGAELHPVAAFAIGAACAPLAWLLVAGLCLLV